MDNFSVYYRNPGHWDICTDVGRVFRIRGGPGNYQTMDERDDKYRKPDAIKQFKTLTACMIYICDELMYELIVVKGQEPTLIESWNV